MILSLQLEIFSIKIRPGFQNLKLKGDIMANKWVYTFGNGVLPLQQKFVHIIMKTDKLIRLI